MMTVHDMPEIDFARCKIIGRGHHRRGSVIGLDVLRRSQGLTQQQVAEKADSTQSEISRAEKREDCLVSTVAKYAKALGGELELCVVLDGRRHIVGLGNHAERSAKRVSKPRKRAA